MYNTKCPVKFSNAAYANSPILQDSKTTEKARTARQRYRTMQATHFRMAEGVDAGLTKSAVRLLSWVRMGSKLVVSFATDGPAAAAGIGSIASASTRTGIYTTT